MYLTLKYCFKVILFACIIGVSLSLCISVLVSCIVHRFIAVFRVSKIGVNDLVLKANLVFSLSGSKIYFTLVLW